MEEERALAITGKQACAPSIFEHQESVLNAGVLLGIPALLSQGLEKAFRIYAPLPPGFYGLHHIIIILCFMALCRIKNPEQLKKYPPGELGKLLGLDRIPEVGYFRRKLQQITVQSKTDDFHNELFRSWTEEMPEMFFYVDGHVRVYHGGKANLPKRFVSREKLCLSGTTEFWVNDENGLPLMVVTAELNEKLKSAIEEIIPKIKKGTAITVQPGLPVFTLVFDREAYEPAWFKKLWDQHQVAVITYRKNVKDKWKEELFHNDDVHIFNTHVTMQLCEMGTQLSGLWFREIRKLSASGHQAAILTTHPELSLQKIAGKMFTRWTQENFFKYMSENFDFDRMIEYGTEPVSEVLTTPNPTYRRVSYLIKKAREKKSRLEARVLKKLEGQEEATIEKAMKGIAESSDLIEQVEAYKAEIEGLLKKRENTPSRISIADMPEEERYNKLRQESKKLKNAILMLAYRAETALYNIFSQYYKANEKEGRMILKEIFTSDADMIPDYKNKQLIIKLHSLSTPRANEAVKKLCEFLNETQTHFPYTDLTLVYKTVAA
jgi:hypothetical protein